MPRPTKRRTREDIATIKKLMRTLLEAEQPMTVRQMFYRLVSMGAIAKTEAEYKTTVTRLLGEMRKSGEIPYDWIADNTRWMRKPRTYSDLESYLNQIATSYRRDLWREQDTYVEVWLEKEALAGVLYEITAQWDVPLMVTRGYPSLSFMHSAGMSLRYEIESGKDCRLFYLGDRDPSGVDIPVFVRRELQQHVNGGFEFEVIAVTEDQIEEYALQTRPTKKTDTRAKNFKGESVEVDAIPPAALRELVEQKITGCVDPDVLDRTIMIQQQERESAILFAREMGAA